MWRKSENSRGRKLIFFRAIDTKQLPRQKAGLAIIYHPSRHKMQTLRTNPNDPNRQATISSRNIKFNRNPASILRMQITFWPEKTVSSLVLPEGKSSKKWPTCVTIYHATQHHRLWGSRKLKAHKNVNNFFGICRAQRSRRRAVSPSESFFRKGKNGQLTKWPSNKFSCDFCELKAVNWGDEKGRKWKWDNVADFAFGFRWSFAGRIGMMKLRCKSSWESGLGEDYYE